MKQATATKTIVGLDVGTSRIVIASEKNGDTGYASQLNAFVNVPWTKMTDPEHVHGSAARKLGRFGRDGQRFQIIEGDVNGDRKADFSIAISDPDHSIAFSADDFIL